MRQSEIKKLITEFKADEATKNMEDEQRIEYIKTLAKRYGIDLEGKNTNISNNGVAGNNGTFTINNNLE